VTVLPSYRVPVPVLRQIEIELIPLADTRADEALALADVLWEDGHLETRLLASYILGHVPPYAKNLNERLTAWVEVTRENNVRKSLVTNTLNRLRREAPERFINLLENWMSPARPKMWINGIHAVIPLLQDPDFENLPAVFQIVKPVIQSAPPILQNDVLDLINALFDASPVETTYFIKQIIIVGENPHTATMLRRIQNDFPPKLKEATVELLRQK
jgi:hypothetical protein